MPVKMVPPLALLLSLSACHLPGPSPAPSAQVVPPSPQQSTPPTELPERPRVSLVTPIDWTSSDVRLVGVNEATGQAILWLQGEQTVSIRAVDLASGRLVERWDATPQEMPQAGRFRSLGGALEDDLVRYAALLGGGDGDTHTPALIIPPGGRHLLYGVGLTAGRDGDAWQVADRQTGRALFRFAPSLVASYELAFSPEGGRVAWSGCCHATEPGGNPYHLYLADIDGPAREVVSVLHPSRPRFASDGETVFVASRHHPDRMCLHRLPFSHPERRRTLFCRASADALSYLFLLGEATGEPRLIVANPRSRHGDYELLLVDPTDGAIASVLEVPTSLLEPLWIDGLRLLFQVRRGLAAADLEEGTVEDIDEEELGGFVGYPAVVRPEGGAPYALVLRGTRGVRAGEALVRVELP